MTKQPPTVGDLMAFLITSGTVPRALPEAVKIVEGIVAHATSAGMLRESQRRYERDRKADYRARVAEKSLETEAEGTSSKPLVQNVVSKKKKNPSPESPGTKSVPDGWPDDFLDQFWKAFPPFRRESRRKVGDKLARIRASATVTWERMIGAVNRFAATDPGQFAPAPLVWLNGERWDREYGSTKPTNGGGNETNRNGQSRGGFSNIAARIRHGVPDAERGAGEQNAASKESNHRY